MSIFDEAVAGSFHDLSKQLDRKCELMVNKVDNIKLELATVRTMLSQSDTAVALPPSPPLALDGKYEKAIRSLRTGIPHDSVVAIPEAMAEMDEILFDAGAEAQDLILRAETWCKKAQGKLNGELHETEEASKEKPPISCSAYIGAYAFGAICIGGPGYLLGGAWNAFLGPLGWVPLLVAIAVAFNRKQHNQAAQRVQRARIGMKSTKEALDSSRDRLEASIKNIHAIIGMPESYWESKGILQKRFAEARRPKMPGFELTTEHGTVSISGADVPARPLTKEERLTQLYAELREALDDPAADPELVDLIRMEINEIK